jgi:hypothetical protein
MTISSRTLISHQAAVTPYEVRTVERIGKTDAEFGIMQS